jgi:hypothetical protein
VRPEDLVLEYLFWLHLVRKGNDQAATTMKSRAVIKAPLHGHLMSKYSRHYLIGGALCLCIMTFEEAAISLSASFASFSSN